MKIKVTDDQVDDIVLWEMGRHSRLLKSNIDSLRRKKKLKKYEKEDLKRYSQVLNAMLVVLSYYGS